jgi:hypothetical protein
MFLIGIFKVPWNYLSLKMISSFVLTQKKQTACAKALAVAQQQD